VSFGVKKGAWNWIFPPTRTGHSLRTGSEALKSGASAPLALQLPGEAKRLSSDLHESFIKAHFHSAPARNGPAFLPYSKKGSSLLAIRNWKSL
jgi:hypothetical protein